MVFCAAITIFIIPLFVISSALWCLRKLVMYIARPIVKAATNSATQWLQKRFGDTKAARILKWYKDQASPPGEAEPDY